MPAFVNRPILAVLFMAAVPAPADAGGSISLADALTNMDAPKELTEEIDSALRQANVAADAVICSAVRFGRHWTYLGGGRAAPYECEIAGRTLIIEGRHDFRDESGKAIPDAATDLPQRAASARDVDVSWQWK